MKELIKKTANDEIAKENVIIKLKKIYLDVNKKKELGHNRNRNIIINLHYELRQLLGLPYMDETDDATDYSRHVSTDMPHTFLQKCLI